MSSGSWIVRWIVRSSVVGLLAVTLMPWTTTASADCCDEPHIVQHRRGVVTDPDAPASTTTMRIVIVDSTTVSSARWQLRSGTTVVLDGVADLTQSPDHPATYFFDLDPTAANEGTPLQDGGYGLTVETTDADGTAVSRDVFLELAFAPPPDPAPRVAVPLTDVIPSAVPGVRSDAAVEVVSSHVGPAATVPDGEFEIRNAGGEVVRTTFLPAECDGTDMGCQEQLSDGSGHYRWSWDGRAAGKPQPAGRYTLRARLPDRFGRMVEHDLGPLWIRHLETVRGVRRWTAASHTSYSRAGRCSAVSEPGPHGWSGSVGLLSLSRCRSTAGSDDLAAQTFRLVVDGAHIDRVASWRLDAYGGGVRRGMTATLHGLTSHGWQRSAVLGRSVGWHNGTTRTSGIGSWSVSSAGDRRLVVNAQAQAINGSRYSVKYVRTVLTYRAWVR